MNVWWKQRSNLKEILTNIENAPSLSLVIQRFFTWLQSFEGKVCLFSHNSKGVEEPIFYEQCNSVDLNIPSFLSFHDTGPIFRKHLQNESNNRWSLEYIKTIFDIQVVQTHQALEDTKLLFECLIKLQEKYYQSHSLEVMLLSNNTQFEIRTGCSCKKVNCKNRKCSCYSNSMKCSTFCHCLNCQNKKNEQ